MELTVGLYLLLHKCHVMYGDSFFYGKDLMSQIFALDFNVRDINFNGKQVHYVKRQINTCTIS